MSDCPHCNGDGWIVEVEPRCCQGSDYECGGRGCIGPLPEQVQAQCPGCDGTGKIEEPAHE
jgi:DnaJ-class molecular chaperone